MRREHALGICRGSRSATKGGVATARLAAAAVYGVITAAADVVTDETEVAGTEESAKAGLPS